jgi:uncharacterized damage-inducible protein DinB
MKETAKENLLQLMSLLNSISESDYTKENDILTGATIGQHIRHILEFYLLLVSGSFTGTISYDKRERNPRIENNLAFARDTINLLIPAIRLINEEDSVMLEADYTIDGSTTNTVNSSVGRELAYCIEHSIHHQALIKAGLIATGLSDSSLFYYPLQGSIICIGTHFLRKNHECQKKIYRICHCACLARNFLQATRIMV